MQHLDPTLSAFLAIDRRESILRDQQLAPTDTGCVLFADVSGFTPLMASLMEVQGADRGAETMAGHLASIFSVLVDASHRFGGSVVGFAGDAITCWFAGDDGVRALTSAFAMQQEISNVAPDPVAGLDATNVSLKVAVAHGPVMRLLAGAREVQVFDLLAGSSLDGMAAAEVVAEPGEILADESVVDELGARVSIVEWRTTGTGRAAVVRAVSEPALPAPLAVSWPHSVESPAGNWLLPTVYERLKLGSGAFEAEFRSVAVVFVRFAGLDFDHDPEVGNKLDAFVSWAQRQVQQLGGTVLAVTLGDKGSYLHATFGALQRHEDDANRALQVALVLRDPPTEAGVDDIRIGISSGTCYVGPFGCAERQTFGALGHDLNKAARLMALAGPRQALVCAELAAQVDGFAFEDQGLHRLKGFADPVGVSSLLEREHFDAIDHVFQTGVSRPHERDELLRLLHLAEAGLTQVALVEGPAGIGKSHLLAELRRKATDRSAVTCNGSADAIGRATPYHALRSMVRIALGIDDRGHSSSDQRQQCAAVLESLGGTGAERLALLNDVVGTNFDESDLTEPMTGRVRADNTIQLITSLVDRWRNDATLLIALEDAHWFDSATWAAIGELARLDNTLLVATSRPVEPGVDSPGLRAFFERSGVVHLKLGPLDNEQALALASMRLGARELPPAIQDLVIDKAEGNPFFVEELVFALRDSGRIRVEGGVCRLLGDERDMSSLSMPETIEGVVLSRIDLLPTQLRLVVRVASVIGRVFGVDVLRSVHPVEEERDSIPKHLGELDGLDIAQIESIEPFLTYIFRHAITRDVAYGSITFAQRHTLHRLIGEWYEVKQAESPLYAPVLAYHWGQAGDRRRAVRYLSMAGAQALRSNANREALEYLLEAQQTADDTDAQKWDVGPLDEDPLELARRAHQIGEANYRLGQLSTATAAFGRALDHLDMPVPDGNRRKGTGIVGQLAVQALYGARRRVRPPAAPMPPSPADLTRTELAVHTHERLLEASFMGNDMLGTAYSTVHSLHLAQQLGPSSELADAYSKMCISAATVPLHRLARAYERLAHETLAEAPEDPLAEANVLMSLSLYRGGIGDRSATGRLLGTASTTFERFGNRERHRIALELCRLHALSAGELDRHLRTTEQLLESAERDGDKLYHAIALSSLMTQVLLTDQDAAAVFVHLDAAAEFHAITSDMEKAKVSLNKAAALVRLGRLDEAFPAVDDAVAGIAALPPLSFGLHLLFALNVEIAIDLWVASPGRQEQAGSMARRAWKSLSRFARVYPISVPRKLVYQGRIRVLDHGADPRALAMIRRGLGRAIELDMPIEVGVAHLELGRALPAGTERVRTLDAAARVFERMGAVPYVHAVDQVRAT